MLSTIIIIIITCRTSVLTGARSCSHRPTRRSTSHPNTSPTAPAPGLGVGVAPRLKLVLFVPVPVPALVPVAALVPGLELVLVLEVLVLGVVMVPRASRARERAWVLLSEGTASTTTASVSS